MTMKVAIMGAGMAGLSCAITLEKNGIFPTILESRGEVGDRFVNGEAFFSVLYRPVKDGIAHISNDYGIYLQPITNIDEITFHSKNRTSTISGRLGFTNIRGRHPDSYEKQLADQVKSNILFNSNYTYDQLKKEFTHIVMATGDAAYAVKEENYRCDLTVTLKGATVEGSYDVKRPMAWLNYDFAPKGYAYLMPYSEREANIVIGFPDYPENKKKNINELWDMFYNEVCAKTGQNLRITDNFEIENYILGICKYPRIGNTFYTGNCFGSIMPALGFGQMTAIQTGVFAAYDICGKGDYEKLTKVLGNSYKNSLALRRTMEQLDNDKLDSIVELLGNKLTNNLINENRINLMKIGSYALRPWVRITGADGKDHGDRSQ